MKITLYQNKRNPHKFIEVKHTNDRHYMWRQYLEWNNGVKNFTTGTKLFRRYRKGNIADVINSDYVKLNEKEI